MGFFSDLLDPGKKHRDAAAQFAQQAQVTGGSFTGPGGIGGGFSFGEGGRGQINLGLGSFSPFLGQLQGLGGFGIGLAQQGLDPRLQGLAAGSIADLGPQAFQRFGNIRGAGGLQDIFAQAAGIAQADPFALGESTTAALRARSTRSSENLVNRTFDRLFRAGGLSSSVMREEVAGDLARQLDEQDLGFQLAGQQVGQQMQQAAFGRAMGAFGGLEQFGGRMFGEQMQQAALNQQAALSRFGIGQAMQNMQMQQMMSGAQLGMGALAGAQQLSQLPLSFLAANLQAQGLRSEAALGGASAQANLAQHASSPLLGAIGAIGQFGSAIGGFGGLGDLIKGFIPGGGGGGGAAGSLGTFGGGSGLSMFGQANPLDVSHLQIQSNP